MNPSNASTPIIVQGTAVTNPNQFGSGENKNPYHNVAETNPHSENLIGNFNEEQNTIQYGQQQQQQPKQYKDGIWAVAFIVHLLGMFVLIGMNVTVNEDGGDGGDGGNGIASVSFLLFLAELLLLSAILSSFTISLMMKFPTEMIKVALIFSTVLLLLISISGFIMGDVLSGGLCLFFFVITCCYVKAVWCRIPFAASEFPIHTFIYLITLYYQRSSKNINLSFMYIFSLTVLSLYHYLSTLLFIFDPSEFKYGINCHQK